jgi:LuxR family maltose regulon positive regulatory protein
MVPAVDLNLAFATGPQDRAPRSRAPARLLRPRVVQRIRDAAAYGIALIVAPAGYGKSEALRQCYDENETIAIELDDGIPTVEAFLRELVGKASRRSVRGLRSLLERTPPDQIRETLVPWVATRLRTVEHAIVIDNLQVLNRDERAPAVLRTLIESTRHSVTWILASRETPQLPLGTWIAKQWMHMPVGPADLTFSEAEVRDLGDLLDLKLSSNEVARLRRDTDGWPVALQLLAAAGNRPAGHFPDGLRSHDVLFAYMDEQLWSELPPADQRLLEFAALLPRVHLAVLEAAGFERAGPALEALTRQFPFIDRARDDVFRLHDIFRDYINRRHRLDRGSHAQAIERMATVLAERGMAADALGLFASLGAGDRIIALLGECGYDLIEGGERAGVAQALAALTGDDRKHPVAAAIRGWLHSLDGSFTSAEADMRRALADDAPEAFAIAGGQRLAVFWLNRGRYPEALELATELLGRVEGDSVEGIELHAALAAIHGEMGDHDASMDHVAEAARNITVLPVERRPRVLTRIAVASFRAGSFGEAERVAGEAAALASELGLDTVAAMAYSVLYSIAENTNPDTNRADFYAGAMRTAARNAGDVLVQVASLQRMLYNATVRGDDEAVAEIERELTGFRQVSLLRDTMQARIGKVIREIGNGRFVQAKRLLETMDERNLSNAEKSLRLALYAIACVANGDSNEAGAVLDIATIGAAEGDAINRRNAGLARMYRALAYWLLGRGTAARRTIAAEADGLTESDRAVAAAIDRVCALARQNVSLPLVQQATEPLAALGLGGHIRFISSVAASTHVTAHLTRAELAVLRSWRTGDTIHAVAERLGKSAHTVNSHMGAIYRKTGSGSRAEALEFARHHGLLLEKSH